jgi:diadenosine tetraphosphate (Ap4A) HIT family hydrolase
VLPRRHVESYFDLGQAEINAANQLLEKLRQSIVDTDPSVEGFNIGVNSGEAAGQTIFHCHIHLIPRRSGDVDEPKGGVRNVIPSRGNYTET